MTDHDDRDNWLSVDVLEAALDEPETMLHDHPVPRLLFDARRTWRNAEPPAPTSAVAAFMQPASSVELHVLPPADPALPPAPPSSEGARWLGIAASLLLCGGILAGVLLGLGPSRVETPQVVATSPSVAASPVASTAAIPARATAVAPIDGGETSAVRIVVDAQNAGTVAFDIEDEELSVVGIETNEGWVVYDVDEGETTKTVVLEDETGDLVVLQATLHNFILDVETVEESSGAVERSRFDAFGRSLGNDTYLGSSPVNVAPRSGANVDRAARVERLGTLMDAAGAAQTVADAAQDAADLAQDAADDAWEATDTLGAAPDALAIARRLQASADAAQDAADAAQDSADQAWVATDFVDE